MLDRLDVLDNVNSEEGEVVSDNEYDRESEASSEKDTVWDEGADQVSDMLGESESEGLMENDDWTVSEPVEEAEVEVVFVDEGDELLDGDWDSETVSSAVIDDEALCSEDGEDDADGEPDADGVNDSDGLISWLIVRDADDSWVPEGDTVSEGLKDTESDGVSLADIENVAEDESLCDPRTESDSE